MSHRTMDISSDKNKKHINPVERGHIAFRTDDINGFKKILYEMVEDSNKKKFDEINN